MGIVLLQNEGSADSCSMGGRGSAARIGLD
jgi:hypothetical protein